MAAATVQDVIAKHTQSSPKLKGALYSKKKNSIQFNQLRFNNVLDLKSSLYWGAAPFGPQRVHHTNSKSHCQQCKITPVQGQLKCLCTFLSCYAPSEKYWPIFNLSFSVQFLDGRPVNFFHYSHPNKITPKKV